MPAIATTIADRVTSMGIHSVYGEPIELDGVSIVPVALVQFGFGGGGDSDDAAQSGGGGGGVSVPVGAYVRDGDGVRFEPNMIALLAVGIPFVWVAGHALARVLRALKKRRR
jgi:uncharacterized spore protein YtfJ